MGIPPMFPTGGTFVPHSGGMDAHSQRDSRRHRFGLLPTWLPSISQNSAKTVSLPSKLLCKDMTSPAQVAYPGYCQPVSPRMWPMWGGGLRRRKRANYFPLGRASRSRMMAFAFSAVIPQGSQ
jgi:hypothetical protein